MMPGTPIPTPNSSPEDLYLSETWRNGFAHVVQDVVTAQRSLRAERDFLHELSLLIDGRDAKVGSTQIYTNGKIRHKVTKGNRLHPGEWNVDFGIMAELGKSGLCNDLIAHRRVM
jgi:hypothetical protein